MNPQHQYDSAGYFTIVYHYVDENGCSDSATRQITVFELPDVNFSMAMTNACVNTQVDFAGISNSNIVSWEWDFGDGQSGIGQNISHVYTTWGTMNIFLTVTDINGCSESELQIIIIAEPPNADFSYSSIVC